MGPLALASAAMRLLLSLVLSATIALGLGCAAPARPAAQAPVAAPRAEPAPGPGVGQLAPRISLKSIEGAPLSFVPGKVTLVVFWATWSEPDKKELIKLQELYVRHGPAILAVIALSVDDEPTHLAEFAKTYGLRFPIGWDAEHRIAAVYRPATEPSTYVVDRAGIIRFVHHGYHDGEAEEISSEVTSLAR